MGAIDAPNATQACQGVALTEESRLMLQGKR